MPGKGKTITTGKLGEVMQESIQAALSVVRTRSRKLGVKEDFYQKNDIHIHLPEGATPKDGPSAGIGIATSMVSVLTGIPVRSDVAMTGEITLRGEVLQIGGLKEKLLAAHRGGIKTVLIPEENVKDLAEIPDNIKNRLEIVPVKWIDKVLEIALERQPEPLPEHDESAPIPPKPDDQAGAVRTINKADLIEQIAQAAEISKSAAERAIDALVGAVKASLRKDETVTLVGFGTFYAGKRAARTGRNPRTNEPIDIKAARLPKFAPARRSRTPSTEVN